MDVQSNFPQKKNLHWSSFRSHWSVQVKATLFLGSPQTMSIAVVLDPRHSCPTWDFPIANLGLGQPSWEPQGILRVALKFETLPLPVFFHCPFLSQV